MLSHPCKRTQGRARDDTLLCDVEQRSVLEVATERTQATVQPRLECLDQLEPVEREGPTELREVLSVLRTWGDEIPGICAILPIQLSSGFMEGKNNRTKTLMRQAYGYRNRRNLQLRILRGVAS